MPKLTDHTKEEIEAVNPTDGRSWRSYHELNDEEKIIRNKYYRLGRIVDDKRGWTRIWKSSYNHPFVDSLASPGFIQAEVKPSDLKIDDDGKE